MNRRNRWTLLLLPVVLAGCKPPPPQAQPVRPVRAIKAGDFSDFTGRAFPGAAQATEVVELSFRVSGPLITRSIDVGDVVAEGQELARIDPRDFEVNLRNVQAQLEQARAQLTLTEDQFQRAQTAHARGAVSEIELSRERAKRDGAQAQVDALAASVDAAQDVLDYTVLKAPFAGTVVAIYVENFEDVRARQAICRIVDDSRIEMIIDIPEHLISMVPWVRDIRCTFDAFPGVEVPATVKEIGREASALTRTFPVTLIMDQPEGLRVLAGMTGEARSGGVDLPSQQTPGGIVVPLTAVASTDGETSFVWVIDETTIRVSKRTVTLGPFTEGGIFIEGIEPGTWIATAGVHYLQEGQQVRLLGGEDAGAPS